MKQGFVVTITLPPNVSADGAKQYVRAALTHWCKTYDQSDPIFELKPSAVRVVEQRNRKKK